MGRGTAQAAGPLAGPADGNGLLGQARPHGLNEPRGGPGLLAARGPCRCKPAGQKHEAMQAGPVAQFLFIYFLLFPLFV
jgi:hypothetical protein